MGGRRPSQRCRMVEHPETEGEKGRQHHETATRGQQARRGCLRITSRLRNSLSSCNHRGDHPLESREFSTRSIRAGMGKHPRHRDFTNPTRTSTTLRPLPREVEVWDISDRSHVLVPYYRVLPLAIAFPYTRSGRSARFFLARHRAGDPLSGGSARWRRWNVKFRHATKFCSERRSTRPPLKSRGPSSYDGSPGANADHRSFERIRSEPAWRRSFSSTSRSPAKASFAVDSPPTRSMRTPAIR